MEKTIETLPVHQMIFQKDQEIAKLKAAIEFDLNHDDDVPSDRAVETLKLLIEQRNRLKSAVEIAENPNIKPQLIVKSVQATRSKTSTALWATLGVAILTVPGVWYALSQSKAPKKVEFEVNQAPVNITQSDPVHEAIRESMTATTSPNIAVTFQMSEIFNDLELSVAGKARLKESVLRFAQALGTSESAAKNFFIKVHHSPTYHEKLTDYRSRESASYKNKKRSTTLRAQNIFNYLFGDEIGDYPNKARLHLMAVARGMSFEEPVWVSEGAPLDKTCGKIDCAASRRVELSF